MTPERLVAGLDIGSSKTTAIIAEVVGELPRHPGIKVLGVGQARTTGLRRGVVADIEEATRSIKKALTDAERMSGARVDHLYTGIAGEHMEAMISKGIVIVSGEEISRPDIDRVNAVARTRDIPQDRELLHAIPQEYTVDGQEGIREPAGMVGTRLETEMYLVTIASAPATNLRRAVERAGYKVQELVLEPLASALAVLTEEEKELGVGAHRDGRWIHRRGGVPRGEDQAPGRDHVRRQQRHERHRTWPGPDAGRRRASEGTLRLRVRADGGSRGHDRVAEHRGAG